MGEHRIRLAVRVHPRASRVGRVWDGKTLELWLREPAIEGVANEAVVRVVADWLGVSRSRVSIQSGLRSRSKIVEINGPVALPSAENQP